MEKLQRLVRGTFQSLTVIQRKFVLSHEKEFICRGLTCSEKLAEKKKHAEEGKGEGYLLPKRKSGKTREVKEKYVSYVKLETTT